jgi:hypothetical protein
VRRALQRAANPGLRADRGFRLEPLPAGTAPIYCQYDTPAACRGEGPAAQVFQLLRWLVTAPTVSVGRL